MATAVIAILVCATMCGVAWWANARFRRQERLPMQWWLTGEVTWTAPRPIALAFVPALAVLVFAGLTALSLYTRPRPGQEGMLVPADIAIGILFLASQILHLWLIEKTIHRNDR